MAESYRDKYVLQKVQEGESYDEWDFRRRGFYTHRISSPTRNFVPATSRLRGTWRANRRDAISLRNVPGPEARRLLALAGRERLRQRYRWRARRRPPAMDWNGLTMEWNGMEWNGME